MSATLTLKHHRDGSGSLMLHSEMGMLLLEGNRVPVDQLPIELDLFTRHCALPHCYRVGRTADAWVAELVALDGRLLASSHPCCREQDVRALIATAIAQGGSMNI